MGLSRTSLALSATAASVLTVLYAPQYSISASYVQTLLVYFSILAFGRLIWTLIVYPKLFDPLRHLPSPPVSLFYNLASTEND